MIPTPPPPPVTPGTRPAHTHRDNSDSDSDDRTATVSEHTRSCQYAGSAGIGIETEVSEHVVRCRATASWELRALDDGTTIHTCANHAAHLLSESTERSWETREEQPCE